MKFTETLVERDAVLKFRHFLKGVDLDRYVRFQPNKLYSACSDSEEKD
jgi:hypothetical protein